MSQSTVEIINRFRAELHEDFLSLSRKQRPTDQDVSYLGVQYSRIRQELHNAVELFSQKEDEPE